MSARRTVGGGEGLAADFEPIVEQPVELTQAVANALHDILELIALACVAPAVLEAERRQCAARARRSPMASRRAA